MMEISITNETHRRLLSLKNHWSFTQRKVTNKIVLTKLNECKRDIFGYDENASIQEIEEASLTKPREQLEKESEGFQRALNVLIESGIDFEPEYTLDQHLRKMAELIEDGNDTALPIF